ncbi:MAG: HPF/RaiA family ribosome-associated protein [Spirochaetales bacterium]|nr:HPF/RaiA family ribosome-associated protein [Spirochaetales bacterium]
MDIVLKGVHYDISEATRDFTDKKIKKLDFAENDVIDVELTYTHTKTGYIAESNTHLKWGARCNIKVDAENLYEAIEKMIDKTVLKIKKEKDKKISASHQQ